MDEFKSALEAFLKNELELGGLLQALEKTLASVPDSAEAVRRQLEAARDARKLSLQDYAKLDLHILQFDKQQAEQSVEDDRATWRDAGDWPDGWERAAPFAAQPGSVLKNTYRLRERLAQGPTGEVWEAFDLAEDERQAAERHIALKLLSPEFRRYPQAVKHFMQQFERYRALQHPNLARVYDAGRSGGSLFVTLELLSATPLNRLIEKSPTGLPLEEVRNIVEGIAGAFTYAHQNGLAHLDLTPENIYYDPVRKQIKVVDYGLIKLVRKVAQEQPSETLDKLEVSADAYASCELLSELDKSDPSDGVYSLACLAYELLSGNHPFGRTPCPEARAKQYLPTPVKNLKPAAWQALLRGLAFERRQRTATPATVAAELFPQATARRTLAVGAALAGVAVLAVAGYFGLGAWRDHQFTQSLLRGEAASIEQLENLPPARQERLLQGDGKLRQTLLAFYLEHAALDRLERYPPGARTALLQDPAVESRLVEHYRRQISQAVDGDNFDQAQHLLARLEQDYPRALDYPGQRRELDSRRDERLAALGQRYQECLHLTQTPLHDRMACLLETRQGIGKIAPRHELLADAELPKAFQTEAEKLLQAGAYIQAALVLQDWALILPDASPARDSLSWTLARSQEIEQGIAADDFTTAERLLKEALALYPASERFQAYDKELLASKAERLKQLSEKYQGYLEQGKYLPDPDAEDLFDMRERIARIDPQNPLLKDAKLHKTLFDRAVELSQREEDSLGRMQALFAAWKTLFDDPHSFTPADQEQFERAKNRVILRYLVKAEEYQKQAQNDLARGYLEFALSLSPSPSLREKIEAGLLGMAGMEGN
jgi:serine/threonine protein kinase